MPLAGSIVDDGSEETDEEQKLRNESRKILHIPDLRVAGTCVRVPVFTGHSLAMHAEFADDLSPDRARGCSPARPGSSSPTYRTRWRRPGATRATSAGSGPTSRRRRARASCCSSRNDNLRKGAALNAVQIAELVAARQLSGSRA